MTHEQSLSVPASARGTTPFTVNAFAAQSPTSALAPATIRRRALLAKDVLIDVLYCGICHSDVHQARNEWSSVMLTTYPCVPGHEIVGRVAAIGRDVRKHKEGDLVAVGCMVDSCGQCAGCREGVEQFCSGPATFTYNGPDKHLGGVTFGGYSKSMVVDEHFVLRVPKGLNPAAAAPLVCAGITTYSPLRHWKVGKGKKVGVVGLGGLGHMAVKFSHAFGARTVAFTTSPRKTQDALRLGADEVVLSTDTAAMQKHLGTFDFILDTVSAVHDLNAYLDLLARDGTMTLVGAPGVPVPLRFFSLLFGRRNLAGSIIGGIQETQEMLDFCAEHGIAADVEVLPVQQVNTAYERLMKGDVKYRFVLDMASL